MTCIRDWTSLDQTWGHHNIALSRRSIALRVCLVQLWIPKNLISGISCGKAAVS
jgi:hypothetical protein